jgi:hypothetical protein
MLMTVSWRELLSRHSPYEDRGVQQHKNVRPQFNVIELYAVMLLWIEILMLIAA